MPSVSKKQAHLMAAVAHGWHPPKSSGIDVPVKVAREFNQADKRRADMAKIVRRRARAKR